MATLAAAAILLFLTSWILLPPPTAGLLRLAVGAPEFSAWLLIASVATAAFAARRIRDRRAARVALVMSVVAAAIAASPFARLRAVVRDADRQWYQTFGPRATLRSANDRPSPLVVRDLLLGIPAGEARVMRGIAFASPEGVPLTTDVYRPPGPGQFPIVVQIYGGAWQRGAPGDDAGFAAYLAAHGYVVFAIDYRHAPRFRWPALADDIKTAIAWIRNHAGEYGGNVQRMAILGRSAGAHLALHAAFTTQPPPQAVVSLYGPTDLAAGYRELPSPDPYDVRDLLETLMDGTPDTRPNAYQEASPMTYASARQPPALLIYGARDHIVLSRFGQRLHERLRAAGTPSIFIEIPWAEHAFDAVPNGPSGQLALYYIEQFLSRTLTQ